jgi:hypothetical protein
MGTISQSIISWLTSGKQNPIRSLHADKIKRMVLDNNSVKDKESRLLNQEEKGRWFF